MYHVGFTFTEAWNIPVAWRRWFIQRINAEHERQREAKDGGEGPQGAPPDIRKLLESSTPTRRKKF